MRRRFVGLVTAALLLAGLVPVVFGGGRAAASHGGAWHVTERVSVSSSGSQANGVSWFPSVSADGRYVAFASGAENLVDGQTPREVLEIFVHDRVTGVAERVSVDSAGNESSTPGGGEVDGALYPSISADGRYVAFTANFDGLVPDDTNDSDDVFVHDRVTGVTERVSVDSAGNEGNSYSGLPSISADGRHVAFPSSSDNLVPNDTNGWSDILVHDRVTGVTERVSVDSAGNEGNFYSDSPSIGADGRYVAFESAATNLVSNDNNDKLDVFVHDRVTGVTERVSVDSAGTQGNFFNAQPSISADGRYVAFQSSVEYPSHDPDPEAQSDILVHDRMTGVTERVSVDSTGNEVHGWSTDPSISDDGRYVAFLSWATSLVAGDTNGFRDVFVHDRVTGVTERASVDSDGNQADEPSHFGVSISADGLHVAFASGASNLVPNDTNGYDVFVAESGVSPSPTSTTTTTTVGGELLPSIGWLATGDSFTSGEGLEDAAGDCQRSPSAYVAQARDRLTEAGWVFRSFPFVPCTGYLVGNLYNETSEDVIGRVKGETGDGSLYEQSGLDDDAQLDLITFSFGGNDIAFSQVIMDCLGWEDDDWETPAQGRCDITEEQLTERVTDLTNGAADFGYLSRFLIDERGSGGEDDVHGSLADLYAYVYDRHLAASNGHLVVVGYPRIFADTRSWSSWTGKRCWGFHEDDADMLGRVAEDLDDTISDQVDVAAASGRNIHYLSVIDEFEDHELCGSEEVWVNSLNDIWHGDGRRPQRAFHPNEAGHNAESDLLEDLLRQLDWPAGTVSGVPGPPVAGTNTGSLRGNPARTGEYSGSGPEPVPTLIWKRHLEDMSWSTGFEHALAPIVVFDELISVGGASFEAATGQRRPLAVDGLDVRFNLIEVRESAAYVTTQDGRLIRFNPATGVSDWARDGTYRSVAVTEQLVFSAGTDTLIAIGQDDVGTMIWSVPVSGIDTLAVDADAVYAATDGGIRAFEALTGRQIWISDQVSSDYAYATTLAVSEDVVLVGREEGLYAFATSDGAELWRREDMGIPYPHPPPAIADGNVVVQTHGGLYGIGLMSGEVRWTVGDITAVAEPAVADGVVYTGDADGVVAIDLATGEVLWQVPGPYVEWTAVAHGRLYVTGYNGGLYAYGPVSEVTDSVAPLEAGLFCRDLDERGYLFIDAVIYWISEGMPDRMDADRSGIPCETVYPTIETDYFLHFFDSWDSGLFCRDLYQQDVRYNWAVIYWLSEGRPDRMDADRNGIPCETVYPDLPELLAES